MKVGDLMKRSDTFKEWIEQGNVWMTLEEEQEIGVMLENDKGLIVVHWPHAGISWEDKENVEVVSESR
jgi:uncharacterized protein YycO